MRFTLAAHYHHKLFCPFLTQKAHLQLSNYVTKQNMQDWAAGNLFQIIKTLLCLQKCTVPVHVAVVPSILKHTENADYYRYDFKEQCPLLHLSTSN